jgi:hypothetical protein
VRMAELAARQHGVVSRRQLRGPGMSDSAVQHRVAVRRLRRVHAGVYAVGSQPLASLGRYLAAVLACGDGAVLSHRSAAALWDLRPSWSRRLEVTQPSRNGRRHAAITTHYTRSLPSSEITTRDGIPCTTPARTLVDLAAVAHARELERALEQAVALGLFDGVALAVVLRESRGRRGVARLRRLVGALRDMPAPVRSELERRFLALVRRARLPVPLVNARLGGHEVDFHWPQLRLGWRQVVDEPEGVTALLRRHGQLVHAHGQPERQRDPAVHLLHGHR